MGEVDHVLPQGRWTFDGDVTAAFDDMLARSIPQYEAMRDLVFGIGARFVREGTTIVDLGASRGEAVARFFQRFGAYNQYCLVEVSEPMLAVLRERFEPDPRPRTKLFTISGTDLRRDYPPVHASLTLCVLTLQFTPIEYRQQIVRRIFEHTLPGGALILVEKVIGPTAKLDDVLVAEYLEMKRAHGYSEDEIQRKRLALEGVLVPVTAKWNEELLRAAGFAEVECFWRNLNFAGWVAVRT